MIKWIAQYHVNDYIPIRLKLFFIAYLYSLLLFFTILDPIWTTNISKDFLQPTIGANFILNLVNYPFLKVLILNYYFSIFTGILFVKFRIIAFLNIGITSILINWINYLSGKIDHQILFWSVLPILMGMYIFEYKKKSNFTLNFTFLILGFFWISSGLSKAFSGYLNFNSYPLRSWIYQYNKSNLLFEYFNNANQWKFLEISVVLIELIIGVLFILKKDIFAILISLIMHLNIEFFMHINFIFMIFVYLFAFLILRVKDEPPVKTSLIFKFFWFILLLFLIIFKNHLKNFILTLEQYYNDFIFISKFIGLLSVLGILFFLSTFILNMRFTRYFEKMTINILFQTILIFILATIQVNFILIKAEPYPLIQGPIFAGNPKFATKNRLEFYEIFYSAKMEKNLFFGDMNKLVNEFGNKINSDIPVNIRVNLIRSIFPCEISANYTRDFSHFNNLGCSWHLHRNYNKDLGVQKKFLSQFSNLNNICVYWRKTSTDFNFNILKVQNYNKICT